LKLSVIFVNWNSTAYLRQCLSSLDQWAHDVERETIVVDNASPAQDVDVLRAEFKEITLIKSPQNLGFARANNLGFQHSTGEYLLFLNPDTRLNSPAIHRMIEQLESLPDAGVVGCRLLNADLSVQTTCIQTFPTILNQALDAEALRSRWPNSRLWGIAPLFSSGGGPAAVEVISGACMLMRRNVFEKIGQFSEEYFMYGEDVDLCYKATRAGFCNYYVGNATVIHYGGGSSTPERATVRKWQSIMRYCVKHNGPLYASIFALVMSVVAIGRLALLALHSLPRRGQRLERGSYSASAKWSAVLRTLLSSFPYSKGHQES
jgi:N-acetylglucosaminyl-diphospho-decaprenol L-rhamnosyltransferase